MAKNTLTAGDIMTTKIVTLELNMTLKEAAERLTNHRVSGAPVVDALGRMVGVLSQTDLVRDSARREARRVEVPTYYLEGDRNLSFETGTTEQTRVSEVMTPVLLCADEGQSVEAVGRTMLDKRMHRIVITREGRPVGIVTPFDVLKALLK